MAWKVLPLMITALLVISFTASVTAADCGNGVCESEEDCLSCRQDCGRCNEMPCIFNHECRSKICCGYTCKSSCIIYPQENDFLSGSFFSNPNEIILAELIILGALVAVILFLLVKKYKPEKVHNRYQYYHS